MRFDDVGELAPAGEWPAVVADATEGPIGWADGRDGLVLSLEVEAANGVFAVRHTEFLDRGDRLAAICRACGVEPRGEVRPEALVGRRVLVKIGRRLAKKTNREYAAIESFAAPRSQPIETRPAVLQAPPTMRPQVPKSEQSGADDIPFAWLAPLLLALAEVVA